jgi:hypothetical protein
MLKVVAENRVKVSTAKVCHSGKGAQTFRTWLLKFSAGSTRRPHLLQPGAIWRRAFQQAVATARESNNERCEVNRWQPGKTLLPKMPRRLPPRPWHMVMIRFGYKRLDLLLQRGEIRRHLRQPTTIFPILWLDLPDVIFQIATALHADRRA